jgi:glyoxylase-like metal-dependent hydrolase (beta-lactamase superfamily II)
MPHDGQGVAMSTIRNLARGAQAFTSNVFLVTGERTVLVDVGNEFDVVSAVEEHVGGLDAVVLTHTHYDHVGNLGAVTDAFDVDVWGYDTAQEGVDHAIEDEETVRLGDDSYRALHTPGHKNDHLCFYSKGASVLFAGDLVFANGSFGRTDLEEGDRDLLVQSIDRVLDTVDEDLGVMHTGHGPSVTDNAYQDIELAWQAARF